MLSTCSFIFFLVLVSSTFALPPLIRIGGLFAEDQLEQQLVFHAALEAANAKYSNRTVFEPVIETVGRYNSFLANIKTCDILRSGPVSIIGPFSEISSLQVQSICEHLEVPHIEARLMLDFRPRTDLSIHLFPHLSTLSRVYLDLLNAWGWKTFAVIFEESESVVHFKEFFPLATAHAWDMKLFQLQPDQPYRDVLWKVKQSGVMNILLDVRTEHIVEVLRQAQQVGILTEVHNYLVTSLDLHTLPLENYRYSRTNITSLRIVQEGHPLLKTLRTDWSSYAARFLPRKSIPRPVHLISQSAMIFDGVQILAQALSDLDSFEVRELNCEEGEPWQYGASVINYIRQVSLEGLTGFVAFDETGFRSKLTFDILSTTETEFEHIGTWTDGVIEKTANWHKHSPTYEQLDLIRVTTVLNDPFLMNTKDSKALQGNDRYEGFVVDLMGEIGRLLNIRFEINLVKDAKYGAMFNATTNEWNGMIGEVIRGEADIAVADLTINSNRELAVDFTYPFMATGISIIYKRPTTKETSLWSFLSPFSAIVWIYLLTAFAGMSLILFCVGRFTPYEWTNPHPCPHHEPVLENALTMRSSFWCSIGSLMQQGSDVAPKALSTRSITAIWYFFTLIIVSSYTANLAAFLTIEKVNFPFENVEELANQTKIRYGCLANGSTHKFFANSNIETYKKMAAFMDKNPQWLASSNAKGRDMVEQQEGKYAFFMESATIEFITERYCNLTQVGGLLDNKGYGVATKKGSKLRGPLSEAILKLQETGVLPVLKDRWWKQKGGGQCIAKPSPAMTELGLKNLGGVFLVLVVGSLFAFMLGIGEFILKTKWASTDKTTFKDDLWEDMKFAFSCWEPTKVLKRKSMKSLTGGSSLRISENRILPKEAGNSFHMGTFNQ